MKKHLLTLLLAIAVLLSNTMISFSAEKVSNTVPGTPIFLGPMEAMKILSDQIAALPASSFQDVDGVEKQKKLLAKKTKEIVQNIRNGKFDTALNKLDTDFRNSIQNWVLEADSPKLIENLNIAIASVTIASQTIVKTTSGKVAGLDAYFNCSAWMGIPYAKPPVGKLRWKAPKNPDPWCKIRFSNFNFSPCVQPVVDTQWGARNEIKGSEDCLYLNVYSPKTPAKKPVYFYIHGGGNYMGEANEYHWSSLLAGQSDVVVVVIQYRLGPFGYFIHPSLNTKGTLEEKSGNYGFLDILKALQWVQENIEAFGGDPNNVTIAGESAGGFNVLNLMASPLAKGLFHRAIAQSPGGRNIPASMGIDHANHIIDKMLVADKTCTDLETAASYRASMTNKQIEAYLRNKTSEELERGLMSPDGTVDDNSPIIDGLVLPGTLDQVFDSGKYNKVPVILGTNKNEVKPWLPYMVGDVTTSSGYKWSNVYNCLGVASPSITLDQFMPQNSDRDLYETVAKYPTLYWKASMVDSLARHLKKHQENVYAYSFNWGGIGSGPAPFDFLVGAGHAFDLSFFFGWPSDIWGGISNTPYNQEGWNALQRAIMSYTASFAATGNPNKKDSSLPVWEEWSNEAGGPKSIVLDADFSNAKISMMNEEFTKEGIKAQYKTLPDYEKQLIERIFNKAKFLQIR